MNCQINVEAEDWAHIARCEAVVIQEYESKEGVRFAHVVAWGDLDEMEDQNLEPNMCIIPLGVTFIIQKVLLVKELISADTKVPESKLNKDIREGS